MATPAERSGLVTQEMLRTYFDYEPDTGRLIRKAWRPRYGRFDASRIGQEAGFFVAKGSHGYRYVQLAGTRYAVHRIAWFLMNDKWPDGEIDHINGIKDDNRIANLRDVPRSINAQNKRSALRTNVSGFLGVSQRGDKFLASLFVGNKKKHIGIFDTAEKAHSAYVAAKREFHPGCTL